jgi:hypothetical protein
VKPSSTNDPFARPALHVLLALAFAAAFHWPIFAFTQPSKTFHFTYGAWLLSLVALVLVSRGKRLAASDEQDSIPPASTDGARDGAVA